MKGFPTRSASPAASNDKVLISKPEVERMIEQELHSAMKKKENRVDALIETIQQQLEQGMNYESSVKNLQARMMTVTKRAEAALTHIQNTDVQNPLPSLVNTKISSHLEEDNTKTTSQNPVNMVLSVSEFMENTKKEIARLHADNLALKADIEAFRGRTTPSPTTISRSQSQVIKGLAKLIKKEPVEPPEVAHSPETSMPIKRLKDPSSPEDGRSIKRIKSEMAEPPNPPLPRLLWPPLPKLPLVDTLPSEAALYNTPPRLKVELARIITPPQLSLLWSLDETLPRPPPMKSYSVFFTTEQAIGSGLFEAWQQFGEYEAKSLPMFSIMTKFKPEHKICITVVGKDKFGRYGPYSKVACAVV